MSIGGWQDNFLDSNRSSNKPINTRESTFSGTVVVFVSLLSLGFVGEMVEVGTTTTLDAVGSQLALIAAAKTLEYIPQGRA